MVRLHNFINCLHLTHELEASLFPLEMRLPKIMLWSLNWRKKSCALILSVFLECLPHRGLLPCFRPKYFLNGTSIPLGTFGSSTPRRRIMAVGMRFFPWSSYPGWDMTVCSSAILLSISPPSGCSRVTLRRRCKLLLSTRSLGEIGNLILSLICQDTLIPKTSASPPRDCKDRHPSPPQLKEVKIIWCPKRETWMKCPYGHMFAFSSSTQKRRLRSIFFYYWFATLYS